MDIQSLLATGVRISEDLPYTEMYNVCLSRNAALIKCPRLLLRLGPVEASRRWSGVLLIIHSAILWRSLHIYQINTPFPLLNQGYLRQRSDYSNSLLLRVVAIAQLYIQIVLYFFNFTYIAIVVGKNYWSRRLLSDVFHCLYMQLAKINGPEAGRSAGPVNKHFVSFISTVNYFVHFIKHTKIYTTIAITYCFSSSFSSMVCSREPDPLGWSSTAANSCNSDFGRVSRCNYYCLPGSPLGFTRGSRSSLRRRCAAITLAVSLILSYHKHTTTFLPYKANGLPQRDDKKKSAIS